MKQISTLINYFKIGLKAVFLILFVTLLLTSSFKPTKQIYTICFPDPYDGFMPIQKYAAERLSDIPDHRSSLDSQMRDLYWASTTLYAMPEAVKKSTSKKQKEH